MSNIIDHKWDEWWNLTKDKNTIKEEWEKSIKGILIKTEVKKEYRDYFLDEFKLQLSNAKGAYELLFLTENLLRIFIKQNIGEKWYQDGAKYGKRNLKEIYDNSTRKEEKEKWRIDGRPLEEKILFLTLLDLHFLLKEYEENFKTKIGPEDFEIFRKCIEDLNIMRNKIMHSWQLTEGDEEFLRCCVKPIINKIGEVLLEEKT